MTTNIHAQRAAHTDPGATSPALRAMLEARSVALVGASARPGSFGARMIDEVGRSASRPAVYLVNPRYREIGGQRCYPSLAELPGRVDLALLGVADGALEEQLRLAAGTGARSAVIFGNAWEPAAGGSASIANLPPAATAPAAASGPRAPLRDRLAVIARSAGMELCGAGCMGFLNVTYGLRATGYTEPDQLPAGPVALITHSGSVFSALLRTRRAFGFTLAVSSGQELVTTAPSYLSYALEQPETELIALVLEAIREPARLRWVLAAAAERDLPVVLLTTGTSEAGRAMVAAHSGALAGGDGGWEALARAYGVHRVGDLAELADTLELFSLKLRGGRTSPGADPTSHRADRTAPRLGGGIATVHDSGLERTHVTDVADELGVRFAAIGERTKARLAELLDPGLLPVNPLDVWGTGADTRQLFGDCLTALAADDAVAAVALAVDLVTELDGDDSYPLAALDAAARTSKPVAVLSNLASGIDPDLAAWLRRDGIAVLEGTRSGLLALRHLLDQDAAEARRVSAPGASAAERPLAAAAAELPLTAPAAEPPLVADPARRQRALRLLAAGRASGEPQLALLREYGIDVARAVRVTSQAAALDAAAEIGYPVVLKTDEPSIAHKSDARGVILGIRTPGDLCAAYADLAARLGPAALVCEQLSGGVELALGIVRDPALGPLLVIGAGGILVELIGDRAVALPPVTPAQARELLSGLKVRRLLDGVRGARPTDLDAVVRAITGLSELAAELADEIEALDINPLICGPARAAAVDALVIPRKMQRLTGD